MDLKIRITLISVFLICFAMNPAYAVGQEYEIQFGAFLIRDNAERLKNDLLEIAPDVYLVTINASDKLLFFSVRMGPYSRYGEAVAKLNAIKKKDASLESMIMLRETFTKASEEAQDPAPAEPVQKRIPVDSVQAPAPVEPVTGTDKNSGEVADALWGEPENESALDDSSTDSPWGEEDSSPGDGGLPTTTDDPGSSGNSPGLQALETEINELKEQVKTLLDAEEIRGELQESEEEKEDRDEDILEAAGRNYTLMKKGGFGFEYNLGYNYYAYDSITEINVIEHNSNHTITNTFTIEYPMRDNLTLEASIPFVYEYDAVGRDDSKHVTDFGDVRFGASFQPLKSGGKIPSMIFNTTLTCPMGRSPYEVNPDYDLSTGNGGYSLEGSVSLSKAIDPIMAFGTLSYNYRFPIKNLDYKIGSYTLERYDRGDSLGFSVGLGYSVSYITSVTLGYSYSYAFKSKRYYKETMPQDYATQTSSSLSIGSSWRLSDKLRVNISLGIGLGNSEYFSISFRLPMEFGRD